MNSRSKKYYEGRKAAKAVNKLSSKVGYGEQNEKSTKRSKADSAKVEPAVSESQNAAATQDDTGGGNDSGKRSDEN